MEKEVKSFYHIKQAYLARAQEKDGVSTAEVRIRMVSQPFGFSHQEEFATPSLDHAFLTVKTPVSENQMIRQEVETSLDLHAAQALMEMSSGYPIEKTRYLVHRDSHVFEIDVYHGRLEGLVLAEVELSDINENISLPPWLGADITQDKKYKNASLSLIERYTPQKPPSI